MNKKALLEKRIKEIRKRKGLSQENLAENPSKIEDFYKIIIALTK